MAVMGVLNHAHGGWEEVVVAPQNTHDANLAGQLMDSFVEGDVVCADRAFCTYEILAGLLSRKAHGIMRLHQARHRVLDLRKGKKLGKNQRLVTWKKPLIQPSTSKLSATQWAQLPAEISIRLIWFSYRDRYNKKRRMVIATTLADPVQHPWEEVAAIYASRWDIELRLRDLKTTLGIEIIHSKSPEMAVKNLHMALLASNLVRVTAQQASQSENLNLREISFKGALDTINAQSALWLGVAKQAKKLLELWQTLIETVAGKRINLRPGRSEPRATKRRPKSYRLLTHPRAVFPEIPHRGKARSWA